MRKPSNEFYVYTETGLPRPTCKECCRAAEKERKSNAPPAERTKAYRSWRRKRRANALLNVARHRAKTKGLECTVTVESLQPVIDAGVCQLTGIPFNLDDGKTWDSPSLDRKNNSVGYTPENTRVVLYCVNVMANVWGPEKILDIADAIRAERSSRSRELQDKLTASLKRRLHGKGSPLYKLTWRHWDMPSGPPICALRASGRRISANDFSGWPTLIVNDLEKRGVPVKGAGLAGAAHLTGRGTTNVRGHKDTSNPRVGRPKGNILGEQALMTGWPTSNILSGGGSVSIEKMDATGKTVDGKKHTASLEHAVKFAGWGMPNATNPGGTPEQALERKKNHACGQSVTVLNHQVQLVTLGQASSTSDASTTNTVLSRGWRLNPLFSLNFLMGFPMIWTTCALRCAMRGSFSRSRKKYPAESKS